MRLQTRYLLQIFGLFFTFYRLIEQMTAHLFTTIKGTIDLVAQMKKPERSKQCHSLQFAKHIEFLLQKFVLVAWRFSVLAKSSGKRSFKQPASQVS